MYPCILYKVLNSLTGKETPGPWIEGIICQKHLSEWNLVYSMSHFGISTEKFMPL